MVKVALFFLFVFYALDAWSVSAWEVHHKNIQSESSSPKRLQKIKELLPNIFSGRENRNDTNLKIDLFKQGYLLCGKFSKSSQCYSLFLKELKNLVSLNKPFDFLTLLKEVQRIGPVRPTVDILLFAIRSKQFKLSQNERAQLQFNLAAQYFALYELRKSEIILRILSQKIKRKIIIDDSSLPSLVRTTLSQIHTENKKFSKAKALLVKSQSKTVACDSADFNVTIGFEHFSKAELLWAQGDQQQAQEIVEKCYERLNTLISVLKSDRLMFFVDKSYSVILGTGGQLEKALEVSNRWEKSVNVQRPLGHLWQSLRKSCIYHANGASKKAQAELNFQLKKMKENPEFYGESIKKLTESFLRATNQKAISQAESRQLFRWSSCFKRQPGAG